MLDNKDGNMEKQGYKEGLILQTEKKAGSLNRLFQQEWVLFLSLIAAALIMAFILLVVVALFTGTSLEQMQVVIGESATAEAFSITMISILVSFSTVLIVGTPAAYALAIYRHTATAKVMKVLLTLPLVLPPAIAGLSLLMAFGKNGLLGEYLEFMGIQIPFTIVAVVIAQIFVSMPLYVDSVLNGFSKIDDSLREAAMTCGAGHGRILFKIFIPIAKPFILSGATLCVLRALGEFGATMLFAGNVSGKTQTITTLIYTFAQQDIEKAVALAVLNVLIFVVPLIAVNVFLSRKD
jgi:molybdate transport system permease protein